MKKILFTLLFLAVFSVVDSIAATIEKQTFEFAVKEGKTLRLDVYNDSSDKRTKPCFMFAFGGAFISEERDSQNNVEYLTRLAENGYVAVGFDYRLGLQEAGGADLSNPLEIVNVLNNAIEMAVEDLFDATNFVLKNADQLHVDKSLIIANGSSSGAIAALQGEYNIVNKTELSKRLPEGFNYAGIVSFAGAIFSTNGDLEWNNPTAPMLLFHGDADNRVPYDKVEMFNIGFYGSKHIAEQMKAKQSPYQFFSVTNAGHEVATDPMVLNVADVKLFVDQLVIAKRPYMIDTEVDEVGKPEQNKSFEILDYIMSNFK